MTSSKSQKERMWRIRKEQQNSHGKVPSFKELGNDVGENPKQK